MAAVLSDSYVALPSRKGAVHAHTDIVFTPFAACACLCMCAVPPTVSDFWQISKLRVLGEPLESDSSSSSAAQQLWWRAEVMHESP